MRAGGLRAIGVSFALILSFSAIAIAAAPFQDVTVEAGLAGVGATTMSWGDFNNDGYPDFLVGCWYLYKNNGPPNFTFERVPISLGGAHGAWADVNNDGYLDIYCPAGGNDDHLWINQGPPNYTFVDRTDFNGDGTPDMVDGTNSIAIGWGDYDLDGSVDVYVGSYERHCGGTPTVCADCQLNTMWKGNGNGTFTNVTHTWGLDTIEKSFSNIGSPGVGHCVVNTSKVCTSDADCAAYPADSCKTGLCARGINVGDFNNDGLLDIHVSDYRLDPNLLLQNAGAGHWSNASWTTGAAGHCTPTGTDKTCGHTLGSDWGDMDNDGDLDMYTSNLAHWWGQLAGHDLAYLWQNNNAGASFTDVRSTAGMRTDYNATGQVDQEEGSAGWADYDNDGDLDLYVTGFYPFVEHWSTMYRNDGDTNGDGVPNFTDVSDPGGADACPGNPGNTPVGKTCLKRWYSWTAVWADYDRDGNPDLLTSGSNEFFCCSTNTSICPQQPLPSQCTGADPGNRDTWPQPASIVLFHNTSGNSGRHWLEMRLVGQGGVNRAAIGTRVTVTADINGDGTASEKMIREVSGGQGYETSQGSMVQHVGLGAATRVAQLDVKWQAAGNPVTTFTNLDADTYYVAYRTGSNLRRGTSPIAMPIIAPNVQLYPYRDPVLGDAQPIYYYQVDDALAIIDVTKKKATGEVVIAIRN